MKPFHPIKAALSKQPVYLSTGAKIEMATDIRFTSPGFSWSQKRTYNSSLTGDTRLGNKWMTSSTEMYLVQVSGGLELLASATSKIEFTGDDTNGYEGPDYKRISITHNSTSDLYTLTNEDTGAIAEFHDFTVTPSAKRGKIATASSMGWEEAGKTGLTYSYDGTSGRLTHLTTSNGQACKIEFTYSSDRLASVAVIADAGTGDTLEKVEYTYFTSGNSADIGSSGDLVQVKRSWQAAGDSGTTLSNVRYTQYRYDSQSRLKGVFGDLAIKQIISDNSGGSTLTTPGDLLDEDDDYPVDTGVELQHYAGKWVEYYASNDALTAVDMTRWTSGSSAENLTTETGFTLNRNEAGFVKSQRIGAVECSSCGGGDHYTKHYYYLEKSGAGTGDNDVKYAVIEDTADSTGNGTYRTLYGLNGAGIELRRAYTTDPYVASPDYWCSSVILADASNPNEKLKNHVAESRGPSAHSVSDSTLDEFLDPSTGTNDTTTLKTSAAGGGPIHVVSYNSDGRPTSTKVKQGSDGTAYYVSATDWSTTAGQEHLPVKEYFFSTKTTSTTGVPYRSFTYDFWSGSEVLKTVTITLPTVSTSQNGSGSSTDKVETWYDQTGRKRWTKDAEGYVTYYSYDTFTGEAAYTAVDVDPSSSTLSGTTYASSGDLVGPTADGADTARPTRGTGLPIAYLNLEQKTKFDPQGRSTLTIDSAGRKNAIVYEEDRAIYFADIDSSGYPQGSISYSNENAEGKVAESIVLKEGYTSITTASNLPTGLSGTPGQGNYISWTRYEYDDHGRTKWVDRYHSIPSSGNGDIGDEFDRTAFYYDSYGRRRATVQYASGTVSAATVQVSFMSYDDMNRPVSTQQWVDTSFNFSSDGYSSLDTDAMSKPVMSETVYDDGGVGDGHVTASITYHTQSGGAEDEYTYVKYYRDFRGRTRGMARYYDNPGTGTPIGPFQVSDFDWMGRATATAVYDDEPTWSTLTGGEGDTAYADSTSTDRRSLSRTMYDDRGQVYRTEWVAVSSSGAAGSALRADNYYNRRGDLVATGDPYGVITEYAYDGAGRQYQSRVVKELDSTGPYSSGVFVYNAPEPNPSLPASGGDENVIELTHMVYDDDGSVTEQHHFEANHDDTDGLDLDGSDCVRTTNYSWYDTRGRLTTTADYGSGNGSSSADEWEFNSAPTRGSEPAWTDAAVYNGYALVTKFDYDDDTGRQDEVISGVRKNGSNTDTTTTKTFYDDAGRRLFVVENWQGTYDPNTGSGYSSNADEDRETGWAYNGLGQVTELTARNGSDSQTTKYWYEDAYNASLATHTAYPDSTATPASGTDLVEVSHHLDGSIDTRTDQRGTVLTYRYDTSRRVVFEDVTTVGTNVDDAVRSIGRAYDEVGRVSTITSYAAVSSGSAGSWSNAGSVENQIEYEYGASHGRLAKTKQSHSGAVGGSTPYTQYSYDGSTNGSGVYSDGLRIEKVTYPVTGSFVQFQFFGLDDQLHRPSYHKFWDVDINTGGDYALTVWLEYNGVGRVAELYSDNHASFGVNAKLSYTGGGGYDGWDRFGRVKRQEWKRGTTTLDKFEYTHDLAGNRLSRDLSLKSTLDQDYAYDDLQRLQTVDANGTADDRFWELDQLGNWGKLYHNTSGTGTAAEERTHNDANELTGFTTPTANADPMHDAAGNMTTIPQPADLTSSYAGKYDAWNRLVNLDSGSISSYVYDGLNRRIKRVEGSDTTHFYYNEQWQVLTETDGSGNGTAVYSWNPDYVDSLAVRMTPTKNHFFTHDALYNVTAAIEKTSGNPVVERYHYTPHGQATVLHGATDADGAVTEWDEDTGGSDIGNEHLYTGRRTDPGTGLQLNRNRYYHQQLGRWVSRDPIGITLASFVKDIARNSLVEAQQGSAEQERLQMLVNSEISKGAPYTTVDLRQADMRYVALLLRLYSVDNPISHNDPTGLIPDLPCTCKCAPTGPPFPCPVWAAKPIPSPGGVCGGWCGSSRGALCNKLCQYIPCLRFSTWYCQRGRWNNVPLANPATCPLIDLQN